MASQTVSFNLRSRDDFAQVLSDSNEWRTIDDLVAICDESDYWETDFAARAMANAKKSHIRRIISKLKDEDGFPLFPSIVVTTDDGTKKRVYKQETLFDVEDYKTIVNYHAAMSNHHRDMAEGYVKRCKKRHEVQLSLWDLGQEVDDKIDDEWTDLGETSPGKPR